MRVISGLYRGKSIKTIKGDSTRPTLDHVKESLFNIIQFKIDDSKVLDLFAGSGQLGIEALSRGAKFVEFCEINKSVYAILLENLYNVDKSFKLAYSVTLENLHQVDKRVKTNNLDYKIFLKSNQTKYDIIFIDPPYELKEHEFSLNLAKEHLEEEGFIVCESEKSYEFSEYSGLEIYGERIYGNVKLTFFKKKLVIKELIKNEEMHLPGDV